MRRYRQKEIMEVRQTTVLSLFAFATFGFSQDFKSDQPRSIPLTVPASVPLRLYLTKRVPKRVGAPVDAKLVGPVYAFDHEVIPVGTQAIGHVSGLQSVSKWERTRAILGGDFTPLHVAQIEFTSLVLPDGREVQVQTVSSAGLNSLVPLRPPKQRNPNAQRAGGVLGSAKQKVKDQTNAQIDRIKGIPDLVRGTNKKEWLSDYMMSRLPYHPQYVRSRTRFDAELAAPLNFGSEALAPDSLALLGTQPASGSVVHARLLTPLDSGISAQGQKVGAVLDEPLFSAEHKLVLPEGTRVDGSVVFVKRAGWFHHTGRLRFNFQNLELPEVAGLLAPPPTAALSQGPPAAEEKEKRLEVRTHGTLSAAEGDKAPLKVDSEGGVQATESKTRPTPKRFDLASLHHRPPPAGIRPRNKSAHSPMLTKQALTSRYINPTAAGHRLSVHALNPNKAWRRSTRTLWHPRLGRTCSASDPCRNRERS